MHDAGGKIADEMGPERNVGLIGHQEKLVCACACVIYELISNILLLRAGGRAKGVIYWYSGLEGELVVKSLS